MLELNCSSNEAQCPAEWCLGDHSAGQRSISDNPVHLWHDEIHAGQVRDRRCPMCNFSVTDGRCQHEDEGAMQLGVCSHCCRLCCRIQLQTAGNTLRDVRQSSNRIGTSTGLRTLPGLHMSMSVMNRVLLRCVAMHLYTAGTF